MQALCAGVMLAVCAVASAQTIAGRWVATGKTLENGEVQKAILDLKQDGKQITGYYIRFLGFEAKVKGTIAGRHFEVFFANWNDSKPFLVGDLADGKLVGTQWGDKFIATPASPADDFPKLGYIDPPPLNKVPYNGLAKTPPMGWNSWNLFAERIDDKTVRTMADAMVSSGMKDAGYIYVNIDDTWQGTRDAKGVLHTNHKFPDMKALVDYVHSKGLKIGIYSSPGPRTCGGYPASYGYEAQDAKMFADWGMDYLKYDWCSAFAIYKDAELQPIYQRMGEALRATGRPIVYSLCEYGNGSVEKWGTDVSGNLWRTTGDIRDEWGSMIDNIEKQAPTASYAGPGHWNDPDMLEIGIGHMTEEEYRTHMSLWALTAAPLLAGNDIRTMSESTRSILLNEEVIAIDQDPLGKQASPVKDGDMETWIKPLSDGSVAVGVVNLGSSPKTATIKQSELPTHFTPKTARDLWSHRVDLTNGEYTATIPAHGVCCCAWWRNDRRDGPDLGVWVSALFVSERWSEDIGREAGCFVELNATETATRSLPTRNRGHVTKGFGGPTLETGAMKLRRLSIFILLVTSIVTVTIHSVSAQDRTFSNAVRQQAEALLKQMTLDEKAGFKHLSAAAF
jgi:alpha-galactosidase